MSVQYTTLHPEGDTGTDLYPKTDVSQIADLPVSARKQLYAHYITINDTQVTSTMNYYISAFFINSDSTPITSIEGLKTAIKGELEISGYFKDSSNREGVICGGNYSPTSGEINIMFKTDTAFVYEPISAAVNPIGNFVDVVVELGSNAG